MKRVLFSHMLVLSLWLGAAVAEKYTDTENIVLGSNERETPPPLPSASSGKYTPPKGWKYNTTSEVIPGMLNVHLVPHTHDDTGWLMTVDQYYYKEVFYILDTVTEELAHNPDRKFIYVETGFLARWWHQVSDERKELFKKLVKRGQLEFINGGWCMHDEASPHFFQMVDQTTRGHQFLLRNFGVAPRVTWQIDPFGHSNTQAWLLGAEAGFEGLFFGRMDYQDFNVRKQSKNLEWIWQGSKSIPTAKIL
jgi:alpha-mannosidase